MSEKTSGPSGDDGRQEGDLKGAALLRAPVTHNLLSTAEPVLRP